jgi:hypothetical protein
MTDHLILFSRELTLEDLINFWASLQDSFEDGLVMGEFFEMNIFSLVKGLNTPSPENLISCRLFNSNHQVKIRRITDDLYWAVSDVPLDGFNEFAKEECCPGEEKFLFLWGDFNPDIGYIFEERIPYLLSPATLGHEVQTLIEKDRLKIKLVEFMDKYGNILWDRFSGVEKWEGKDGGQE